VLVSADAAALWTDLVPGFAAAHPEVELSPRVVSAKELQQAAIGGEEALIISAGPTELGPIAEANRLAPGSGETMGEVRLSVIVAQGNPEGIRGLEDLASVGIAKLGISATEGGAVAKASEEALRKAKVWAKVKDRLLPKPPRELAGAVASGEADAAIVGAVLTESWPEVAFEVPSDSHSPLLLTVARTTGLALDPPVKLLVEYLTGPSTAGKLAGYDVTPVAKRNGDHGPLLMYCGAGIREAAQDLIDEFGKETGVRIEPTYTGSGCLLAQITIGQMGDLYLPGEDYYMEMAEERGWIAESKVVAYFLPVILVEKGNPKGIHSLQDLLKPGLRVGLGEPKSCAIGDFTPKVLAGNGISMDQIEPNVVAYFVTAPELGNAIKIGAVDAVIQWDALAHTFLDGADAIPISATEETTSPIPLGTLTFSKHAEDAKRFLDFVAGPRGQAVFAEHSYTTDPTQPSFPSEPETP